VARIAIVHELDSSFVVQDVRIVSNLAPTFDVRWKSIRNLGMLVASILRSRVAIVWFACGQAAMLSLLIAKLFHKRFVALAAGSQVSKDGRVRGFGLRSDIGFVFTRLLLNTADCVMTASIMA
jgi:hypothetical protein